MGLLKDNRNLNMENFKTSYIRKCKASTELQSVWTPKKYDYYGNVNYSVQQIETDDVSIITPDFYWVPSLYQIIDLCRNIPRFKAQEVNDLNLLSKMRISVSSTCCNNYLNSQSMHDFWLMFYMEMTCKKDWNEGANRWT